MNLEVNEAILVVEQMQKKLVELYQLQALGKHRAATDLSIKLSHEMSTLAMNFSKFTLNIIEEEMDGGPQLRLIK